MDQSLAVILQQLFYSKITFIVFIPGLVILFEVNVVREVVSSNPCICSMENPKPLKNQ